MRGSGEDHLQQLSHSLKVKYRQMIGRRIGFDAALANLIFAGATCSDAFAV
jgi:hypothetical protein